MRGFSPLSFEKPDSIINFGKTRGLFKEFIKNKENGPKFRPSLRFLIHADPKIWQKREPSKKFGEN